MKARGVYSGFFIVVVVFPGARQLSLRFRDLRTRPHPTLSMKLDAPPGMRNSSPAKADAALFSRLEGGEARKVCGDSSRWDLVILSEYIATKERTYIFLTNEMYSTRFVQNKSSLRFTVSLVVPLFAFARRICLPKNHSTTDS